MKTQACIAIGLRVGVAPKQGSCAVSQFCLPMEVTPPENAREVLHPSAAESSGGLGLQWGFRKTDWLKLVNCVVALCCDNCAGTLHSHC